MSRINGAPQPKRYGALGGQRPNGSPHAAPSFGGGGDGKKPGGCLRVAVPAVVLAPLLVLVVLLFLATGHTRPPGEPGRGR